MEINRPSTKLSTFPWKIVVSYKNLKKRIHVDFHGFTIRKRLRILLFSIGPCSIVCKITTIHESEIYIGKKLYIYVFFYWTLQQTTRK